MECWSNGRTGDESCKARERFFVLVVVVFLGISSTTNAQLHKLNVVYTATSPYQSAAIIARDTGLFRKHGLDVTMIFITVLDEYAKRIPKAKTMKPEEFMDSSFVKKLDDEKFYEWLY